MPLDKSKHFYYKLKMTSKECKVVCMTAAGVETELQAGWGISQLMAGAFNLCASVACCDYENCFCLSVGDFLAHKHWN